MLLKNLIKKAVDLFTPRKLISTEDLFRPMSTEDLFRQKWNDNLKNNDFLALLKVISERKGRLIAIACVKQVWNLLRDERSRNAVQAAESYADNLIDTKELLCAYKQAHDASIIQYMSISYSFDDTNAFFRAANAASSAANKMEIPYCFARTIRYCINIMQYLQYIRDYKEIENDYMQIFLDIANPFAKPIKNITNDTLNLANAWYDEQDDAMLPILADSLEESGCEDQEVLNHLKNGKKHHKGCWVLDLILGKK